MLITNKAQYTCHKTLKGEFGMLYLCAGERGAMIFSFYKSTSLEGRSEKTFGLRTTLSNVQNRTILN